jgi:hypothetical protein
MPAEFARHWQELRQRATIVTDPIKMLWIRRRLTEKIEWPI